MALETLGEIYIICRKAVALSSTSIQYIQGHTRIGVVCTKPVKRHAKPQLQLKLCGASSWHHIIVWNMMEHKYNNNKKLGMSLNDIRGIQGYSMSPYIILPCQYSMLVHSPNAAICISPKAHCFLSQVY